MTFSLFFLLNLALAGPRHHLTDKEIDAIPNAFPATVEPPKNELYRPLYEALVREQYPKRIGSLVSILINLGDLRVPILVKECGSYDAFYTNKPKHILICYEALHSFSWLNAISKQADPEIERRPASIILFPTFHEIGHALIDEFHIDVQNEEDAADAFAYLMITNSNDVDLATRVMATPTAFFTGHAMKVTRRVDDEHSASEQRAFAATCVLYGRYRDSKLAEQLGDAAPECIDYTKSIMKYWNRHLRPYTRLESGNTFFWAISTPSPAEASPPE